MRRRTRTAIVAGSLCLTAAAVWGAVSSASSLARWTFEHSEAAKALPFLAVFMLIIGNLIRWHRRRRATSSVV